MAKYVYYITSDGGDGSTSVRFYDGEKYTEERISDMINDDDNCEQFYGNEGQVGKLTFPDDLDLTTVGFYFSELRA